MFGMLKFLFYSCVAVVVGVLIGTVPVGGATVAERIAGLYQYGPVLPSAKPKKAVPAKALARTAPRAKAPTGSNSAAAAVVAAAGAPGPVSAGAANSPDGHTDSDKAGLNQLLAAKARRTK